MLDSFRLRYLLGLLLVLSGGGVLAAGQNPTPRQPSGPAAGPASDLEKADAAFKAGYAAMQAGKLEEARVDFAETVRLAPTVPEARVALGAVLVQLGRPEEAIPELDQALTLKPGEEGTEANLAVAHEAVARKMASQRKMMEAEAELRSGIRAIAGTASLGAQVAGLEDELGSLLAQQERWADAESAFREALRTEPAGADGVGVHIHLGVVLVQEKQLPEGLAELGKAVEAAPDNGLAQFEFGRGLALADRDAEAVPHFEEALRLTAKLPGAALELAMAEQRLGKQAESIPNFEKAVAAEPRNAVALANLGLALTQTGKAKEAVPYLQRALAETPADAVVLMDLGVAELQQSHFDEAIGWFQKALAVDGTNPQVHYDLGLAYKLEDRTDDAVGELRKAIALDAGLPDPPYTLGILYMQEGKLDEAATELRAALALRPGNGAGWAILGSDLKQAGKTVEAEEALRKAVELEPDQPGAHITLAGVLAEEGKTADAAAERKIAAGLSKGAVSRQRAQFSTNAGNQLLLRGEVADAVGRYLEAIAADPGFAEAHAQLAVAYERQGRTAEAAAERTKAAGLATASTGK